CGSSTILSTGWTQPGCAHNSISRRPQLTKPAERNQRPRGRDDVGACRDRDRAGWGGTIRTPVSRNQNPLPYHFATPQAPQQVNRKVPVPATRQAPGPRHICVKIDAYGEDGTLGYRRFGSRGPGRASLGPQRVGTGKSRSREMAVGCHFPVISRLRAIFPDFGGRKFAVSGAGHARLLVL